MSGGLIDLLDELTIAVPEPISDVLISELFTNCRVLVVVGAWVAGNADDDSFEMIHAVCEQGKRLLWWTCEG